MSCFTKFVEGKWVLDVSKARAEFQKARVSGSGVVRWKSNDRVPPQDCLDEFAEAGCEFNMVASVRAREADDREFFAEYRRQQASRQPSAEELFEMRAAFGEGAEVVDVITGRRIKL
jgi:hypothetical protein